MVNFLDTVPAGETSEADISSCLLFVGMQVWPCGELGE